MARARSATLEGEMATATIDSTTTTDIDVTEAGRILNLYPRTVTELTQAGILPRTLHRADVEALAAAAHRIFGAQIREEARVRQTANLEIAATIRAADARLEAEQRAARAAAERRAAERIAAEARRHEAAPLAAGTRRA